MRWLHPQNASLYPITEGVTFYVNSRFPTTDVVVLNNISHVKSGINTGNSNPWPRPLKTASVPIFLHWSGYNTFTLQQTDVCLCLCLSVCVCLSVCLSVSLSLCTHAFTHTSICYVHYIANTLSSNIYNTFRFFAWSHDLLACDQNLYYSVSMKLS